VLFLELRIADEADLADLRARALGDIDLDANQVVGLILHPGVDSNAVLALAEILLGQALLDLFQYRAIVGLAGCQPHVAQRLGEILGLDGLVALDLEALDRGALAQHHDQRAAIAAHLDIAEEARGVQRPDGFAYAADIQFVADVDWQIVEHRAFRYPQQSLDLDVEYGEVRQRWLGRMGRHFHQWQAQQHQTGPDPKPHSHSPTHSRRRSHARQTRACGRGFVMRTAGCCSCLQSSYVCTISLRICAVSVLKARQVPTWQRCSRWCCVRRWRFLSRTWTRSPGVP